MLTCFPAGGPPWRAQLPKVSMPAKVPAVRRGTSGFDCSRPWVALRRVPLAACPPVRPARTTSKWRVICNKCAQLRLVARKKCGPGGPGFSNLGSRFEQPDQPDIRDDVQSSAPAALRPGLAGAAGCHWHLARHLS